MCFHGQQVQDFCIYIVSISTLSSDFIESSENEVWKTIYQELTHVELQGIKSDAIEGIKNYLKLKACCVIHSGVDQWDEGKLERKLDGTDKLC